MITRMEIDRVIVFFNLVHDSEILVIYDQYCQTPNPGETRGLTLLSHNKNNPHLTKNCQQWVVKWLCSFVCKLI